jgi:aminoglycoside 6'-N-acetyltransferase I
MRIRLLEAKDYKAYKRLFDEAYGEYLVFLKRENPQQYRKERREKREVSRARFDFYVKTGSSFVAEEEGEVIGYVASQTVHFEHGVDKLLWIEYMVVQQKFRNCGVGLALLNKLIGYAEQSGIDRIYTTINPDNDASIKLHLKAGFNVEDWKAASYRIKE